MYDHYRAVAQATRLPILLYTNPARTGVTLAADLAVKLPRIENIVGIKDSSGDLTLTSEYTCRTPSDFAVLAGRDTRIYATLVVGGKGAIAATAKVVPSLVAEIYDAYRSGNLEQARAAQNRLMLLRLAFEMGTFPIVIKEAPALRGICSSRAKFPVKEMSEAKRAELANILRQLNVL